MACSWVMYYIISKYQHHHYHHPSTHSPRQEQTTVQRHNQHCHPYPKATLQFGCCSLGMTRIVWEITEMSYVRMKSRSTDNRILDNPDLDINLHSLTHSRLHIWSISSSVSRPDVPHVETRSLAKPFISMFIDGSGSFMEFSVCCCKTEFSFSDSVLNKSA